MIRNVDGLDGSQYSQEVVLECFFLPWVRERDTVLVGFGVG